MLVQELAVRALAQGWEHRARQEAVEAALLDLGRVYLADFDQFDFFGLGQDPFNLKTLFLGEKFPPTKEPTPL